MNTLKKATEHVNKKPTIHKANPLLNIEDLLFSCYTYFTINVICMKGEYLWEELVYYF